MKQLRLLGKSAIALSVVALGVLAVSRGFAQAPAGHFVIGTGTKSGSVQDAATGLTWQRAPVDTPLDWVSAVTYCTDLTFASYSDWRLPTVKELASIVDDSRSSPAVDIEAFPAMPSAYFWTSTLVPWDSTSAQEVEMGSGGITTGPLLSGSDKIAARVICVR